MALLTEQERRELFTMIMSDVSRLRQILISINKIELDAAIAAGDAWADANAASYNSALPVAFRTNATAKQKAMLLMYIISKRHEVI